MNPVTKRLAAALSLILIACSSEGDGQGAAEGPAAGDYFPLVAGARWTYALRGTLQGEVEVRARGPRAVEGLDGEIFIMDEVTDGSELGFAGVAPVGYVRTGGYLGRYLGLDYRQGEIRLLGAEDPVRFLPLEPTPALQWEEETRIFALPETEGGKLRWVHRAGRIATLEVPAGVFHDVLRVESEYWDDDMPERPVLRFEDFYAKGIGLLRSVTYDQQQAGGVSVEQELVSYSFPAPTPGSTPG